jgi:ribonucleoside-diphosphate reductase alpha chain
VAGEAPDKLGGILSGGEARVWSYLPPRRPARRVNPTHGIKEMRTTTPRNRRKPKTGVELVRPDVEVRLSDNAIRVLQARYLKKDASGKPTENALDMFWRVASTIASEDLKYGASIEAVQQLAERFYSMMIGRLWEPNSPTLMNAGRPLGQLSACFVLPVDDALSNGTDGIYDTLKSMALVHQSGGGTGFSFSRLRPQGDLVRSTTGVASGPVSFMELYNASTEVVKQGGTRRGANMGILRVDHPDILEFIDCKQDLSRITNFNISVAITDAFMEAVAAGAEYNLVHPASGKVVGSLDAVQVFDKIVKNAWRTGEPGIFFIDRANAYNPVPHLGSYEATNPCGEQPLLPFDVCNLGSLNVGLFVDEDASREMPWRTRVRWDEMGRFIRLSTHFLDNVIDANEFPLPEIRDLSHRIRRIGNGVMGWADFLVKLGIPYNSPQAIEAAVEFAAFFDEQTKMESERLAAERGVFPEWERSIWGPDETCARDAQGNRIRPMRRLRNCNTNTVAPTGTISIFANCSGGIEPLFAVAFMRNQGGFLMPDVNEDFVRIAKARGFYSEQLMERIASAGHIHFSEVPEDVQAVFVTAHDITPEWHVRMQAAFQSYTDSAISKTTNFSFEATEVEVRQIYELAYSLGCKGVTVYRDGSRDAQPLSTGATKSPAEQKQAEESEAALRAEVDELRAQLAMAAHAGRGKRQRPRLLKGSTRRMDSPLGDVYVTINADETATPFEVFATLGKAGSIAMADTEAIGRLISLALRFGVPINEVHGQLRGISSERAIGFGPNRVLSLPDAIAQAIEQHLAEAAGVQEELPLGPAAAPIVLEQPQDTNHLMELCPDCKSACTLEHGSGCVSCRSCSWSRCS